MLEAFIIDQLNQAEEEPKWQPLPILVPTEREYEKHKEEETKSKVILIRF